MRRQTRYAALAVWLLVSTVIAGCEGGRNRPPAVAVRVLNAAPERSAIDFYREQRSETQLDFRQVSGQLTFDADQYDFNVRAIDASGATSTLIGSFSRELLADNRYFFAITEVDGELTPVVVEKPVFTGTSGEITAVHVAPSLSPMSVYIEPEAVVPAGATPVDTLAFGEVVASVSREPGTYRLTLTEAGNPANVLMRSTEFAIEEGQSYIYAIIDPAEDTVAPITVALIGPEATLLFDENVQSSLTVVNAAADGNPRDVFFDDDFSSPLLAAVPPRARSPEVPVSSGSHDLSITPAGNTGVIEAENTATYARSRRHIALIGGDPGGLEIVFAQDDRRPVTGHARVTLMNGATQYEELEYFIVPPGTDISNRGSTLVLDAPEMTARIAVTPGDYELIVREVGGDVVAGPVDVTLAGGGIYSVLTMNGAVSGTVDLVYLEDFVD